MASRPAVRVLVVAGAVGFLAGCTAGRTGSLAARPTEPAVPKMSLTTAQAIEKHNRNAALVTALEARPRITVHAPEMKGASVSGRMALERPKNFKLEMRSTMDNVADIGSNDKEFWFWTKGGRNLRDNAVFVCAYKDVDRTALSAAFQPDWIIEAMGLRNISEEEAARTTTRPGDAYGTIKLISTRKGRAGESLTKETIIDQSGRVLEHRLYAGEGASRKPLAYARVDEHREVAVPGDAGDKVVLPYRFKLEWVPEKLSLDIQLDSPRLVAEFTDERRDAIFTEPKIPGTRRANLAELGSPSQAMSAPPTSSRRTSEATATSASVSRSRSSRPIPPPGAGVELGSPEPIAVEGRSTTPRDPVALTSDLQDAVDEQAVDRVVRPGLPRPDGR